MQNLSYAFHIQERTRMNFLRLIEPLSIEQLNAIPQHFNNNIAWNFGHIIATQQLLIYGLSNTAMYMENDLISKYRKGSKPTSPILPSELIELKDLSTKTLEIIKSDYEKKIFGSYKDYTTSYGITLKSVEEAIQFNNSHEAMHLGTCIDIIKLL